MELRFVDAFAGIGGLRLAATRALLDIGFSPKCVRSVEWDKNAQQTYLANHGETPLGDITKLPADDYPDHDLLLGGFPCQAFSRNGKFYNFQKNWERGVLDEDSRKNLFLFLVAILRIKKPRYFVFENVKEIQTIRTKDGLLVFDEILEALRECDYQVWTNVLDARDFGLPQQRMRVYFVGIRRDIAPSSFAFPDQVPLKMSVNSIKSKEGTPFLLERLWKNRRADLAFIIKKCREKSIGPDEYVMAVEQYAKMGQLDVLRLDLLKVAAKCGAWIPLIRPSKKIAPRAVLYGMTPSGLPRQQDKLYDPLGVSPTIATFSTPCFAFEDGWRQLTPRECARLQGFPDKFVLPIKPSLAYKQVGNAVTIPVAAAVIREVLSPTCRSLPKAIFRVD